MIGTSISPTSLSCNAYTSPSNELIYSEGVCSLIDKQYVLNDINLMSRKLKMVTLGAHDTSGKSLLLVEREFAGELKSVRGGKKISIY